MPATACINNVTVVDVVAGTPHSAHTVLLGGEKICAVEPANSSNLDGLEAAETVDGTGLFLCPGLIDSHVHFFLDSGSDPRSTYLEASDKRRMEWARGNARKAIEAGITTMRDTGAPAPLMFSFKEEVDRETAIGPHIIACGYALMRPKGHCHFFGGEVADIEQLRERLEWLLELGAGFVKLMASGGGLTPGTVPHEADLALELMREAADFARANGLTTTAHCHATESIERAITAGLPMIEHATFVEPPGVYRYDETIARRIKEAGIAVGPTVFSALQTAQRFRQQGASHNPSDLAAVERLEARLVNTGYFYQLGIDMMAGTDCGCTNTPFDSMVDELLTYEKAGIPVPEVVAMATCGNARLLRMGEVGEVREGHRADLIMLAANPLESLDALREPLRVFKAGKLVYEKPAIEAVR
jgi:imidazolonepropionase-like amidohydrolase